MPRVAATFVNDTYDEHGDGEFEGSALARIDITRTFSGDVDGRSTAELMTVRSADGSAAYAHARARLPPSRLASGHMRNTPKVVSGTGAFAAAARPRARTRRVSRGSMIPSSQSRAVE